MRAAVAASTVACATVLLAACAANSYAGVPFTSGAAQPELQALARRAQVGDKQAQLELGIRYEEGRGVPVDLSRAQRLYAAAAQASGGTRMAYVPAVGRHGRPMTMPVSSGPEVPGLAAAQERLVRLSGRQDVPAQSAAEPFADADSAALVRRFGGATRHAGLTVYPGTTPRACWTGRRPPPLATLLAREMGDGFSVMPLGCLFSAYRPDELRALADRGNRPAGFIYMSLLAEMNGCADSRHADALTRMSDAGYAPASIAIGTFLVRCGQQAPGVRRYYLAEQQGFINARGYYRGLELEPPRPAN